LWAKVDSTQGKKQRIGVDKGGNEEMVFFILSKARGGEKEGGKGKGNDSLPNWKEGVGKIL